LALFWYLADQVPDLLGPVFAGAWIIQAHMFATWAALGPGKFLLRVTPIIAVFLTVLGAPGVHPDGQFERGEFIAMALTGTSIFVVTTLLLLILRRFVGWRIELNRAASHGDNSRYQFTTWNLIVVITLYAVTLGVYTNIVFEQPEPAPFGIFGPDFIIAIVVYGGMTMAVLLLPMIAVPLFVLSARRSKLAVVVALSFWVVLTVGVIIFWHVVEGIEGDALLGAVLLQTGAVVMGLVVAIPLRLAGYRLARSRRSRSQTPNDARAA
jgi:hypothetical protein